MKQSMQVLTSSKTNNWYTPPYIIEMAKQVLGEIDLDPASDQLAQSWIQANTFYTKEDNGLRQGWGCTTMFLNPPYGKTGQQSNQDIWTNQLIHALKNNVVKRGAIVLTKTVPGYAWWDDLFNGYWPGPCCITRDRIRFISGATLARIYEDEGIIAPERAIGGKSKAASTFWYYGPSPRLFKESFQDIGRVILKA